MKPTFNMYAVSENGIVIDYAFGENEILVTSPLSKKNYSDGDNIKLIMCTETSGTFYIGQKVK